MIVDIPARFPDNRILHGGQRQPEQQDGMVQRDTYPFPELFMVEHLGGLRGFVQGRIHLS